MSQQRGDGPVPTPADFPVRWPVTTRWTDNDMFGHLNNAVYYGLFDTAINGWLARAGGADPMTDEALPLVAESGCRYLAELAYPDDLVVGVAVARLGRSSITYRLGLYAATAADDAPVAAVGHWVHVYVDRASRRATPVPAGVRALHEALAG